MADETPVSHVDPQDQDKHEHELGHGAHTHDAEMKGLPGKMNRPIKVTMMGAGSGFTPRLASDIFRIPGNQGGTIALVDIDAERLAVMHKLIEKQIADKNFGKWKVESSTDRREVLANSDYITNCIEVSGIECVRFDNDIPKKYGIDQCIGDTIGPGGLFKSLRTIPVFLGVLQDAAELCPDVIVLNYTNPMNMLILASGRVSPISVVGLCHSVQGTSELLATRAGVPIAEMEWECAGINHLAWFTKLKHKGEDLYPRLKEMAASDLKQALAEGPTDFERQTENTWKVPEHHKDLVRKDMMLHFGAFITESSGHLSEYLPYYRTNENALRDYARPGYDGASSFYADNWPTWRKNADAERGKMLTGESEMKWERSWEYASWIIEAREKNVPHRIHGNVLNNAGGDGSSLISNLPADGCVEVACMIDGNGISPTRVGKLPPQMAALCDWNMRMFDLGATAAIERSKEAAIYALMLDPLSAAVCTPAQIQAMTLELFEAEAEFLPGYK